LGTDLAVDVVELGEDVATPSDPIDGVVVASDPALSPPLEQAAMVISAAAKRPN
jgi:hypothetical protein